MGLFSWLLCLLGSSKSDKPVANLPGNGSYLCNVVGESNYQVALEKICGGYSENGHEKIVLATLIQEDDNHYDSKAVRVDINGMTVGYLSRENARQYRQRLKRGITATCSARIVGGWDRGGGNKGYFGVKLDLSTDVL